MSSNTPQLLKISDDIVTDNICLELREQATQLVFADGNSEADIVFIGEAPGKKEDETGLPFMGAAGKFLNTMLESIGMRREDVYITNIVKYRPPKNRDPSADEKQAFWPYLMRQLDVIKPKLVVTLGRHSMDYFLPGMKIGEVHGELQHINMSDRTQVLLPLYHPAAALYNGGLRQILMEDFARIPTILKQI
ncbi:uracil-DNA glycosylase [Candidatus Saccharibacteria bacterium]|nr:uracil-DNA glycosylase [Candidatus Saccharibacteria bacterium]